MGLFTKYEHSGHTCILLLHDFLVSLTRSVTNVRIRMLGTGMHKSGQQSCH